MAVVLTYATEQQVEDYLELFGGDWSTLTAEQVYVAQIDIDDEIESHSNTINDETGLKVAPADLSDARVRFLQEAVAEQVKYRALMPADYFDRDTSSVVSQDGVSKNRNPSKISPRAKEKLLRAGLCQLNQGSQRGVTGEGLYTNTFYSGPPVSYGIPFGDDGVRGRFGDPRRRR